MKEDVILDVSKRLNFGEIQATKYLNNFGKDNLENSCHKPKTPKILELVVEYLSRLVISIRDLEGKVSKSSLRENINSFVSHKNWSKSLITSINSFSVSNNELAAKLMERIEDSLFDTFHFSEFKNNNSENQFFNTFEYSKNVAKKVEKAISKREVPAFMKDPLSDKDLETSILTAKISGTIYTQDMLKLLIPESGSGVLMKFKKMAILSQTQSRDNSRIEEKKVQRVMKTSGHSQGSSFLEKTSIIPDRRMFKANRKIEASSNFSKETKFPVIVAQESQKMDIYSYVTHTEKFKNKPKPKPLKDFTKLVKIKDSKKKRKNAPSSNYIETLYNPRGLSHGRKKGKLHNLLREI